MTRRESTGDLATFLSAIGAASAGIEAAAQALPSVASALSKAAALAVELVGSGVDVDLATRTREAAESLGRLLEQIEGLKTTAEERASAAQARPARQRPGGSPEWFSTFAVAFAQGDRQAYRNLVGSATHLPSELRCAILRCSRAVEPLPGDLAHLLGRLVAHWRQSGPRDEPSLACLESLRSRLYGRAGLAWLADAALARAHAIDERGVWCLVAAAGRQLDMVERENRDLDEAEALYQAAAARSSRAPEPLLGLAIVAEHRSLWSDAHRYFERAARLVARASDPVARMRGALRWLRFPGQDAHGEAGAFLALAVADPAAGETFHKQVLEHACASPAPAGAPWVDRARAQRAELLLNQGDRETAGVAFGDVAKAHEVADRPRAAVAAARQAIENGDDRAQTRWVLAESLRFTAGRDVDQLRDAATQWEEGLERSVPNNDDSWVLVSRAFVAEALRDAGKPMEGIAAVFFGEWATVLTPDVPSRWAYLARFYRTVRAEWCSLEACERALALAPGSALALEEFAATLAAVGRPAPALKAIERRMASSPASTESDVLWLDAVRGALLVMLGRDEEALGPLERVCESQRWVKELIPDVLRRRGEVDRAREKYAALWDDPTASRTQRAWAAIWIQKAGEAEGIFDAVDDRDDPFDVASRKLWLAVALKDGPLAEQRFALALERLRTPGNSLGLHTEIRDVFSSQGEFAHHRRARWLARLDERESSLAERRPAAERAALAERFQGSGFEAFQHLAELRDAADAHEVRLAAAALRSAAASESVKGAVFHSIATEWLRKGDEVLRSGDSPGAARFYARAVALQNDAAARVRCWLTDAPTESAAPPERSTGVEEADRWGRELRPLFEDLGLARALPLVRMRTERAGSDALLVALAERARASLPRSVNSVPDATLPKVFELEIPPPMAEERQIDVLLSDMLPWARQSLQRWMGLELPAVNVRTSTEAQHDRVSVFVSGLQSSVRETQPGKEFRREDGKRRRSIIAPWRSGVGQWVNPRRDEQGAEDGDRSSLAYVTRTWLDAGWQTAPHWLGLDQIGVILSSRSSSTPGARAAFGHRDWLQQPEAIQRLVGAFRHAARERIPFRAVESAFVQLAEPERAPRVFDVIRAARMLVLPWLNRRHFGGRRRVALPRDLEDAIAAWTRVDASPFGATIRVPHGETAVLLALRQLLGDDGEDVLLLVERSEVRFALPLIMELADGFVPVACADDLRDPK